MQDSCGDVDIVRQPQWSEGATLTVPLAIEKSGSHLIVHCFGVDYWIRHMDYTLASVFDNTLFI